MKGRVGREIDVLSAAGKPLGLLAGSGGEGREPGAAQRRVAHVADAMVRDVVRQQPDPLGVAAADEIAEPPADQHLPQVGRTKAARCKRISVPARMAPVANCTSRMSRWVRAISGE